jgi:hypothetical protein
MQTTTTGPGPPSGLDSAGTRPAAHRWLAASAWLAGSVALFGLFLRISLSSHVNADGAINALQAWDLLRGNVLLHGWRIADANFYFLELPLNAITAAVFGLGDFAAHAASALTYLFVTVCAVALAVTGSRGAARAVRCSVIIMVLAAPVLTTASLRLVLEEPDHIGTSVFILGSFLLIDLSARRVPAVCPPAPAARPRRLTAPTVCLVLAAGQFSDLTVRYVAVPAVAVVCGYRALAARKLRSPDTALVVAAVASVALATALSAVIVWLGGFTALAPWAHVAPARTWPHNVAVTWNNIRLLFGAVHEPGTKMGVVGFGLGLAGLLAAVFGLVRVVCGPSRASRAEQLLCVAIVCNLGIDVISTAAKAGNPHEFAVILPAGAVLAARAIVPERISFPPAAFVAVALTALAAVAPLASAATVPADRPFMGPVTTWLEVHGLRYGIAGYWLAATGTLQTSDRVQIRTVDLGKTVPGFGRELIDSGYQVEPAWYDPALHDATFVIADPRAGFPVALFERAFGKPVRIHTVGRYIVLIYHRNLLPLLDHPAAQLRGHPPHVPRPG